MADQYTGNCIVGLMHQVDKEAVPRPEVEIGGKIVEVGCLKVRVGPEIIESWQRIEAQKRQGNTRSKASTMGHWQTKNPRVKAIMRAIACKAGFPGVFD
jgi:hypothetical protein